MFYGEGLALVTALLWGAIPVFVRKGLYYSTPSVAVLIGLLASIPLLLFIVSAHPQAGTAVAPQAALWFAGVGLLGPCLGRVFNYLGVARLGATRATPLINTSPFFTAILALLFLREQITLKAALGMVCIIAGVGVLTGRRRP